MENGNVSRTGKNNRKSSSSSCHCFFATIVLLLGFAFLLLKLQLDAGKTEIGILVIYVLSCFIGGWYCGRKAGQRKFLWGLLTGILYFLLLLVVSALGEEAVKPALPSTVMALALV
ncbi:MAG: TIGR04086 family membrane protein, partial [Lachnospiraceae bacterium]|nr:TIGR04086 family membrane protein [Lachnospiraceae bacterium]